MKIYLAGGISANLKPCWNKIASMKMFLAGGESRHWVFDKLIELCGVDDEDISCRREWKKENNTTSSAGGGTMQVYMAGTMYGNQSNAIQQLDIRNICEHRPYILESFYYADEVTEQLIPYFGDFLLDSGAFTFFTLAKKQKIDWDAYLTKYIAFIKRNNVQKFFELDLDSIVGYEKVLQFRERLERETGKQCIPVWHKSRGKDEFIKMCENYKYVAIGGIVSKEITSEEYPYFTWFINEAHKRGCKIHGLGFTSLDGITKYHFDSVDSTSWTTGNRFGFVYKFNGKTMVKFDAPKGHRLKDSKKVALNNYIEWLKFQVYADKRL